jgi:hypothetical protein
MLSFQLGIQLAEYCTLQLEMGISTYWDIENIESMINVGFLSN